jgi:AraC-like DNA-binding protein
MRYSPPPPALSDRISSLYELAQDSPLFDEIERADRPQLRVLLCGEGRYHFANGTICPQTEVTLVCPTSGALRTMGNGPVHAIGAGLLPAAWMAIMGDEAAATADCAIDGRFLWGGCADKLHADLVAAPDIDARMAILAAFIDSVTTAANPQEAAFTCIVDTWLGEDGSPTIDMLVERTGLSLRQLERRVKRCYGLPPKTLARKYRALRAAMAMARGEDIEATGLADGFYDQSHLIREVKRFAGMTPQQIKAHTSHLMTEHAVGRKSLEGQVGPLISDA